MRWPPDDPETQRWGAIGLGLLIGLGAKYALLLQERHPVRARDILIDLLLLAANALIASLIVERLGWRGQEAMAVAALIGASSDRLVRIIRKAFERQVEQRAAVLFAQAGVPTVVPASSRPTEVQFVGGGDPRARPIERLAEMLTNVPDDRIEALLRQLDRE